VTKRKITTKALTALMLAFALLLSSFSMPVMADTDFTVTIDLAGGSMSGQTTFSVPAGETLIQAGFSLDTPTRQGFTFDGWSGGFDANTPVNSNMNITAQWQQDRIVTFNLNGGMVGGSSGNQSRQVPHNQSISSAGLSMPQPTKQGYTFNSWQINTGGSGAFTEGTPVTSNMTVVAQWTAIPPTTATVTFNLGGGNINNNINSVTRTVTIGQGVGTGNMPPNPVRAGFVFNGWRANNAAFDASTEITGATTVTAQWTQAPPVTITFNLAGGVIGTSSANVTRNVPHGQSIANTTGVNMPTPTRAGHTFVRWQMTNNQEFFASTPVTANITVTAQWTANNQATVTFNLNGGHIDNDTQNQFRTVPIGQTINNTTNVTMPSNPSRTGYTFHGWRMTNNNTFNGSTIVNSNITVTANWTANNQATITFNLDGGTIGGSSANQTRVVNRGQSINNTSNVSMPTNPTRSGFTFVRWELSNGDVFTGATVVDENITVYAQWVSGDRFVVTFDLNNGRIGNSTTNPTRHVNRNQSINNTSGVSMPANPTRQGFTFNGWEMSNGNEFTGATTVNSNITVTAQWISGNQATVTFNLNGGTIGNNNTNPTRTVTIGQSINNTSGVSMPANPTRQGFTFAGWEMANGNTFTAATVVNSNITVTAQWTNANQATVTFNLNGGAIGTITANQTRDIPIGQNISNTAGVTLPPNPTRQGFVFNGWQMANGSPFNANTIVNNSFTVTAQWTFTTAQNPAPLVNQIITLNEHGVITVGGTVVDLPGDMGRFHINADGVSVLPARAVLSVLFGADPYDPYLFVWYADISTFVIDPQGHNIRIQVNNQTMFVGGMPRTIMSGTGDAAFPYAAYVDPRDSRMYAPVRAIAESVGFTVEWNAATSTVTLIPPVAF